MDELIFGRQSLANENSLLHWWQKKLESRLQTLLNAVKVFSYSRTDNNALVVEALIDEVDQLLSEYESNSFGSSATESEDCLDRLVLIETHQLLAQARSLIGSPKNYGFDNVVELYPGAMRFPRADIMDEEFEAQLAASDLPLLLQDEAANGPCADGALEGQSTPILGGSCSNRSVSLTLVKCENKSCSNEVNSQLKGSSFSDSFDGEDFEFGSSKSPSEHPTDANF